MLKINVTQAIIIELQWTGDWSKTDSEKGLGWVVCCLYCAN